MITLMHHILKQIILIVGLFITLGLLAQEQQYFRKGFTVEKDLYTKFDNYTTDNGLVSDDVKLIFQDQFGYMWFGTSGGLSKFDGYEFANYQYDAKDTTSLSNNFITAIEEDINGDLWIGTKNGLNKLNRTNGTFIRFNALKGNKNSLQDNYIKAVLSDSLGVLWIDTYSGFLHSYQVKDSIFSYFLHEPSKSDVYFSHRLVLERNRLWILYQNKTCLFNIELEQFEYFEQLGITIRGEITHGVSSNYSSFIKDKLGNYYFGRTHGLGLFYNSKNQDLMTFGFGSIYDIVKDVEDQIWIGGYSLGLLKYDYKSNHFVQYKKSDDNPFSLPSNQIWQIFLDKNRNIWFATPKGIAKLSSDRNKIKHVRHISNLKKSIVSNDIKDIIQTKDSNIWIATFDGVSVLKEDFSFIRNHQHDPDNDKTILSNKIKCLYQDTDHTVWLGGWSGLGMNYLKKGSSSFNHYTLVNRNNASDWYIDFAEANNNVFIGFWGSVSLGVFDRKEKQINYSYRQYSLRPNGKISLMYYYKDFLFLDFFRFYSLQEKKQWSIHTNKVGDNFKAATSGYTKFLNYSTYEIPYGYKEIDDVLYAYTNYNIWKFDTLRETYQKIFSNGMDVQIIANELRSEGLWIGNGKKLKRIKLDSAPTMEIEVEFNNIVTGIFITNGIIFIGTSKGLFYAGENTLNSKSDLNSVSYLNDVNIKEFLKNKHGDFIIASDNGLYYLDKDLDLVSHFTENNSKLSSSFIHDIHIDSSDNLWIGTQEGLNLYDKKYNDFVYWHSNKMDPKTLSGNTIYTITENNGDLYLGTNQGYSILNLKSKLIKREVSASENSVQTSLTTCLLSDCNENIWIGNGSNGYSLDYLNTKTNKIKHYHDLPYDSTSYSGKEAHFIFEDSKQNIWIGTDKGLNKFDSKSETFKLISQKQGLPTNNIVGMLEDEHENYWLSSSNGIVKYNEDKGVIKCFTTEDGISSNTFRPNAFVKSFSGELMFGSDKGLTVFHPDSIYPSPELPQATLTRLLIYASLAYDDLSEIKDVNLDFSQNNFVIEFSVLDFINPQKNHYSYRMKGYDKAWVSAPYSHRKAKYTNLPYGNYVFQLLASNHDGLWMEEPIELNISISPPWYKTILAYVFYGIGFIALAFLYGNFRIRRVKQQNTELEEAVRLRTTEINEKTEEIAAQRVSEFLKEGKLDIAKERLSGQEEERRRISRELHDGIAGHLTGVKLFLENILEDSDNEDIKLLLTDIDRLYHEVRNLSHDLLPPEFEETSVKEVLKVYIEQLMLRSDIEINLSLHPKDKWNLVTQSVQIDIYRMVQELLQNALKYSDAKEVDVELVRHSDYISIMIEDNGVGMLERDEKNGTGLKSLKSRIELINGKYEVDSELGRGTIVNLEIPNQFIDNADEAINPLEFKA